VLLLLERNPGRNQTEIANTLGILRRTFGGDARRVESRDLWRDPFANDRRSTSLS